MPKNSIYLGNSLLLCRNKTKDFKDLKDRISQRIDGWNQNLLFKAGRATLITSVFQAIPTYSMSTFRIPKGLCTDLDSLVRRFWWGSKLGKKNYLALKSWKWICCLKSKGALDFVGSATSTLLCLPNWVGKWLWVTKVCGVNC